MDLLNDVVRVSDHAASLGDGILGALNDLIGDRVVLKPDDGGLGHDAGHDGKDSGGEGNGTHDGGRQWESKR